LDDRVPDADQTDHEQRNNEGDEAHSHRLDHAGSLLCAVLRAWATVLGQVVARDTVP
jgi:hypothetical protein